MPDRPEPVVVPLRDDPADTGEVGSEGGSSGDMLRPSTRPDRDHAARQGRGVAWVLWVALFVPIVIVLLWFATSLV